MIIIGCKNIVMNLVTCFLENRKIKIRTVAFRHS